MNILCADIGTTSLKTAMINQDGTVLSFYRQSLQSKNAPYAADQWLPAFINSTKKILQNLSERNISINPNAICISGNGPTVVSQTARTIFWNADIFNSLTNQTQTKLKETRSLFLPNILALKELSPDDWKKSSYIFSGPEYLIYQLSGAAVTILPEERFTSAYWNQELLKAFDFSTEDLNKLPPFVTTGHIAGNLTQEMTNQLGLEKPCPVVCGGPDFIAALIGTNTLTPGKLCDRAGSSEGINFCTDKPVYTDKTRTMPSVIPGLWNISVLIEKSGSLINHFKHEINALENQEHNFEEVFDYAFSDKNSEGWKILFELKNEFNQAVKTLNSIAKENDLNIENKMRVTGGQAKNYKWLLEKAKEAQIDLYTTSCPDAELLGDAIIALTALKQYPDLQTAAQKIVHTDKIFKSDTIDVNSQGMKIFKIPQNLKTIIFDIDSTLYTSEAYALEQVDVQIRAWAQKIGITPSQARNKISEFRKNWSKEHDGQKISLGNTFTYFGVSIEESIQMRRDLVKPENFLSRDEELIETLKKLKEKYKLICVTNNPVYPAQKTLIALGIQDLIPTIIGLDTCGKSKPAKEPFELALKMTNTKPEEALSIGDRYDLDLRLPLDMGMGAIQVSGVKDVYKLSQML